MLEPIFDYKGCSIRPCDDVEPIILDYVSFGDNLYSSHLLGQTLTPVSLPSCYDDVGSTSVDPDVDWHIGRLDKMEVKAASAIRQTISEARNDIESSSADDSSSPSTSEAAEQ